MKKINKYVFSFLVIIFCLYTLYVFFSNYDALSNVVINISKVWLFKIITPIIIMYFLALVLIKTKVITLVSKCLFIFNKLFKFENKCAFDLFVISILCNTPSAYVFINDYYNKKYISYSDYYKLLSISFINPLFLYSFLGKSFIIYLVIEILSNVIVLISKRKHVISNDNIIININIFEQLNKLSSILINILVYMIISYIIIFILETINVSKLFLSFIEISYGLKNNINEFIILCVIIFNGFCMHMQVISVITKHYKIYFIGRVKCLLLSILFYILFFILKYA